MRVRVLTINVQNDEGNPDRIGVLNRGLRELAPDLVAFQEVVRSPDRDQLAELLDGTGLRGTHQSEVLAYEPPWSDRFGGSALACRWPHRIVEALDLRGHDAPDVPWCALAATVELPNQDEVLFITATTAWRPAAESARERQVVALTDLDARHRRTLPTIIAADFNASPDAASIRYMSGLQSLQGRSVHYHDAWTAVGQGPGHTWTTDNPAARQDIDMLVGQPEHRRRFDYIFVGSWDEHPAARATVRSATLAFDQPVGGVWPSDHFGVLAELEFEHADDPLD